MVLLPPGTKVRERRPVINGGAGGAKGAMANQLTHGLRTPNEGINQSYLKNLADVADKICFGGTLKVWDWD